MPSRLFVGARGVEPAAGSLLDTFDGCVLRHPYLAVARPHSDGDDDRSHVRLLAAPSVEHGGPSPAYGHDIRQEVRLDCAPRGLIGESPAAPPLGPPPALARVRLPALATATAVA